MLFFGITSGGRKVANGFCSRHPSKHAVPQLLPKESLEHFRCLLRLKERAPYLSLFKPRVTKSELARVFSANNAVCARLVSVLIGEKHFRRHCRAQCAVIWTRSDALPVYMHSSAYLLDGKSSLIVAPERLN